MNELTNERTHERAKRSRLKRLARFDLRVVAIEPIDSIGRQNGNEQRQKRKDVIYMRVCIYKALVYKPINVQ